MTDSQQKQKEFNDNLKERRFDVCYDISKYLVHKKYYNTAIYTLLVLNEVIKKEPLRYLPYIHKLIAELLNKKYPYIEFYQSVSDEYFKGDQLVVAKSYISLNIQSEDEIFDNFNKHNDWRYFKQFNEEHKYYSTANVNENSWRDSKRYKSMELEKVIFLDEIINKRIKYYNWDSLLNFGENIGKSIKEVFDYDSKIIFDYHNNLHHFTFTLPVLLTIEFFKSCGYGEKYWHIFERNIIKQVVLFKQNEVILEIKHQKEIQHDKHKQELRDFMSDYNGDDDESRIIRGLSEGNGDQFGF